MIFKEKPYLICLLLVIIIGFSFYSTIKSQTGIVGVGKEGLSNLEKDVPDCKADKVHGCYSTIQSDEDTTYSSFDSDILDKYLLKTELLPPLCPSCMNTPDHDNADHYDNMGSSSEGSGNSDYKESNVTNITNEENIVNNNVQNVQTSAEINESPSASTESTGDSGSASGTSGNGSSDIQKYQDEIASLKGELSKLKQQKSSGGSDSSECPPCPAPMRCPEPAFSCQKVLNYSSPAVGQYLPMPVLNDFSTFKEN